MTEGRVEELTALVLDGAATPGEEDELARLLDDLPARRAQLVFLEIEATLRGARAPADQSAAVMERIRRERADRVVQGVMRQVVASKRPARRTRWLLPVGLALTASAMASVALVQRSGRRADPPMAPTEPAPARVAPAPTAAPAPAVRRPVLVALPHAPQVLYRFDFEDATLPPGFIEGHLVPGPCAPDSRGCALGTLSPYGGETYTVAVERPQLMRHAPGLVISFDYWAGADAPELTVMTWAPGNRQNYEVTFESFVRDRWAHAEVRLDDLVGRRRKDHLAEGDRISNILIMAGRTGGKPLYVDNLAVIAYPSDAPLTGTQPL